MFRNHSKSAGRQERPFMATTLVTADPVESVTWRLHDQLVRFLCRVVFMQDAFDFFVYFGVLDFDFTTTEEDII